MHHPDTGFREHRFRRVLSDFVRFSASEVVSEPVWVGIRAVRGADLRLAHGFCALAVQKWKFSAQNRGF